MSLRITLTEGVGAQIGEAYLAHIEAAATRVLEGWIRPYPLLRPVRLSLPLTMLDAPEFCLTDVEGGGADTLVAGFKCDLLIGPVAEVGVEIGTNPFVRGEAGLDAPEAEDLSLTDLAPPIRARRAEGASPALQSIAEDVLGPGARVQRSLPLNIAVGKLHVSGRGRISPGPEARVVQW